MNKSIRGCRGRLVGSALPDSRRRLKFQLLKRDNLSAARVSGGTGGSAAARTLTFRNFGPSFQLPPRKEFISPLTRPTRSIQAKMGTREFYQKSSRSPGQ